MVARFDQNRTDSDTTASRGERRDLILDRLRTSGSVLVADLAGALATSEMTIRRDLKALEAEGMVRRIHGGALLVSSRAYEPTLREKSGQFVDEKRRIGAAAAALVESGDTVILSPGTTTMEVARHLGGLRNLTVVTSAVNIAAELAPHPDIDVVVTGGHLRGTTYALVGSLAEETLRALHVLLRAAERVIVTVDHSKIGRATLCQTAAIESIHVLVTDSGILSEQRRAFERAGIEVIVV
jgi:DeoR/GlpR family transcriptional regulator of sugar metabolism